MPNSLSYKNIIITGASAGLGRVLAFELAKQGANLTLIARNKQKLLELQSEINQKFPDVKVLVTPADISDPKQVKDAINKAKTDFKQIHVLINNAAIWYEGDFLEHSNQKLKELFEINTLGQMYVTKEVLPLMLEQKHGDIVFVNSIAATREYPEDFAPYASTKYAIKGFAESIRTKYAKDNIRIMQIYPPGMETEIFKRAGFDYGKAEWMTDPKNIAEIIVFMLNQPRDVTMSNVIVNKTGFN